MRSGFRRCAHQGMLLQHLALIVVWFTPEVLGQPSTDNEQCSNDDGSGNCGVKQLEWEPKTISVVLPCFNEDDFAIQTVKAVYNSVPEDILKEIIVVDDGSDNDLGKTILRSKVRKQYKVKLLKHKQSQGLIKAKYTGGSAASGDVIVFYDCHVSPMKGWHTIFLNKMKTNYKRVIVPRITDLDIDTWKERHVGASAGFSSCYMTWDVDFKWFDAEDEYVPILSGGLLGISQPWFNETGGYDEQMVGWGGENIDQSLRTWLCGGEIVAALDARVAHMWRTHDDPRTISKKPTNGYSAIRNKVRAGVAWMGEFSKKFSEFDMMEHFKNSPELGDLSNILDVSRKLKCRSFAWFLHRFRNVYVEGGLLPSETFQLRLPGRKKCLQYQGYAGTSQSGVGKVKLVKCNAKDDRQRWHLANVDTQRGGKCCSGLRAWNTDQCLQPEGDKIVTGVCDISGKKVALTAQAVALTDKGHLRFQNPYGGAECAELSGKQFRLKSCSAVDAQGGVWERANSVVPIETKLYQEALSNHPEWQQ